MNDLALRMLLLAWSKILERLKILSGHMVLNQYQQAHKFTGISCHPHTNLGEISMNHVAATRYAAVC